MSIQHINSISNRLSLRPPQRDSLEILARVCEVLPLEKGRYENWENNRQDAKNAKEDMRSGSPNRSPSRLTRYCFQQDDSLGVLAVQLGFSG